MTIQDQLFDRYLATLRARHEQGRKEYGDRSMDKPRAELLGEMQQEAVDIAGWGFFLWAQMERMKGEPSERDAVEQSWFRKMMDQQAANNAEIDRLRTILREVANSGVESESRQYVTVQINPVLWKELEAYHD